MSSNGLRRASLHQSFCFAFALVAAVGLTMIASGAERIEPNANTRPLEILGQAEIGQITDRSADAVFRVDHRSGKSVWMPRATAFVIHSDAKRLLLVTNAHVVEDSKLFSNDVDELKPEQLRVVQRGNGEQYQVTAIYKHPRRAEAMGPDVALLEAAIVGKPKQLPPSLRLLPLGQKQPLLGNAVGLIGFPAMEGVKLSRPYFGGGVVAQEDEETQHIIYDMAADHGSSGSPVFLAVRDDSSGRSSVGEYVVGVHSMRHGERLKTGMHVSLVWEAIAHHKLLQLDYISKLPIERSEPHRHNHNDEWQPISGEQHGSPKHKDEFAEVVRLTEQNELDEAAKQLTALMQSLQQSKKPISWDLHCLAGAIATRRGLQFDLNGQAAEAATQYASAVQSLQRAIDLESDAALPQLLLGRAQNNLGRPTDKSPGDRKLLQATHDSMQTLLERDNLSDREKAQAQYLLGFVHLHLPCGTQEKIRYNFTSSVTEFPSKQGLEWYQRVILGRTDDNQHPDLWNEFTQLAEIRNSL